jgi:hypothetical protein
MYDQLKKFIEAHFPDNKGDIEEIAMSLLTKAYNLPAQFENTKKFNFNATVLYNKGLGINTMELSVVSGCSYQEAQTQAEKMADEKIGEGKWIEVKIRPAF